MPFRGVVRVLQWFQRGSGKHNLARDRAPVDTETFSSDLETEGTIPAELNGVYLRTGPNVQLPPNGGYHLCAPLKHKLAAVDVIALRL